MSRAGLALLLSTDPTLHTLGFAGAAVYGSNAADDPPDKFIIIHWEDMFASLGGHDRTVGPQNVTIWVHDRNTSYEAVNTAIEHIKVMLAAVIHYVGSDGWTITQFDWQGDSSDLWDDGYRTITRNTSFRVAARPS